MAGSDDEIHDVDVSSLLAGASRAIKSARCCWLVTAGEGGFPNARPMGRLADSPITHGGGGEQWIVQFITDGRSGKASDIRRDDRVAIICQHDPDEAFLTLMGRATLHESEAEVRQRWKRAYEALISTEDDRKHATFVEVDVERMALWIRGVTPEPFGLRTTTLERDAGRGWHSTLGRRQT